MLLWFASAAMYVQHDWLPLMLFWLLFAVASWLPAWQNSVGWPCWSVAVPLVKSGKNAANVT